MANIIKLLQLKKIKMILNKHIILFHLTKGELYSQVMLKTVSQNFMTSQVKLVVMVL